LYGNVSRGYKAGSFPTLSASSSVQFSPVRQESVLAYEVGFKESYLSNALQLNGAVLYYDYDNKQIRGKLADPIFGDLEALVNIPNSHIDGAELSAIWEPLAGLTITPGVTLVRSQIDGHFSNYTPLGQLTVISGEPFPYTPKWSADLDAEYSFPVPHGFTGFVGENTSYASPTNGGFGELPDFKIDSYALLDLRAGIKSTSGNWRVSIYGRNVTDKYYWTSASHIVDTITRFAGMPATYGVQASYKFQ
jgi:iron complex outermembrane receptor protein